MTSIETEELLALKLKRAQEKVAILEKMLEDQTRDLYFANGRLEELNASLLDSMQGAIFVTDVYGSIRIVNACTEQLCETPQAVLLGRPLDVVIEGAGELVARLREAAPRHHDRLDQHERFVLSSSGRRIPALCSAARLDDEAGAFRGAVVVALDLSERKQLELELLQAQKLESVGRLAAGVAHEINTPTQFVGDNVRFLGEAFDDLARLVERLQDVAKLARVGAVPAAAFSALDEAAQQCDLPFLAQEVPAAIARAREGVGRVATIVRSMKEFSHPGTTGKAPADLNHALESTATVSRNEWKYVADLVTELEPELPRVECNLGEMNQVFLNLIVNAAHAVGDVVKRKPGSKGRITLRTRRDGDAVEISVADTGTGIEPHHRARIFEPFFTTKEVGRGTGQGLALVRSIVVGKHGGEVRFDTELGRGTTFVVRLPVRASRSTNLPEGSARP
jgi:PAS domain S-box-containing protein